MPGKHRYIYTTLPSGIGRIADPTTGLFVYVPDVATERAWKLGAKRLRERTRDQTKKSVADTQWRAANRDHIVAGQTRRRHLNKDRYNKRAGELRQLHPERYRSYNGMVFAEGQTLESMRQAQDGKCAICKLSLTSDQTAANRECVDHCASTGRVRGLLCSPCNSALGYLKESLFEYAIRYLTKPRVEIDGVLLPHRIKPSMSYGRTYHYPDRNMYLYPPGVTPDTLWVACEGKCEICNKPLTRDLTDRANNNRAAMDHNHSTGYARGWLCKTCNLGIGHAREAASLLNRMAMYLAP